MYRCIYFSAVFIFLLSVVSFSQTQTIQIAGVARTYIVHAPQGMSNPPLLFCIHGYNMDAASQQSYTKMDLVADREKFVVVYPNAINKSWDMSGANDFTFLMAIIDTMKAKYSIDKNRIYSCGFSQGGFMTFQLGCRYSEIFAAIAPTSGNLTGTCDLKRPMSMRLTFGTNEGFTGGTAAFMENVTKWIAKCNCPTTPVVTRPYPASNSKSLVTRLYYGPCDGGTEVIADSIRTGGHEWPMNTSDRINNSEETWAFLKKFSLDKTDVQEVKHPGLSESTITMGYRSGSLYINGVLDGTQVQLYDTRGKYQTTAYPVSNGVAVLNSQASGVYIAKVKSGKSHTASKIVIP